MDNLIDTGPDELSEQREARKKHVSFNDQITEHEIEPVPLIIGK